MIRDIDLRKEIGEILEDSGHYVLLQRTSRKLRCICWDEVAQESSMKKYRQLTNYSGNSLKSCPKCMGAGWITRIERVKARRDSASDVISETSRLQTLNVGQQNFDNRVFYFNDKIRPQDGDYVYEVGWDGLRPTHLIKAYRIQVAADLREKDGRIEYWQAVCKQDNIGTGIEGFTMKRLGPVVNYEILR